VNLSWVRANSSRGSKVPATRSAAETGRLYDGVTVTYPTLPDVYNMLVPEAEAWHTNTAG
jgi:hypothetical protein